MGSTGPNRQPEFSGDGFIRRIEGFENADSGWDVRLAPKSG